MDNDIYGKLSAPYLTPDIAFSKDKEPVMIMGKKVGHTSTFLKDSIMNIITTNFGKKHPHICRHIVRAIKRGIIVPFMYFTSTSGHMMWKLLPGDQQNKRIWGWFTPQGGNKIFLSINALSEIDGTNMDFINVFNLVVHEFMHLAAHNCPDKFFKMTSKTILKPFYTTMFNAYFTQDIKYKKLLPLLTTMAHRETHGFSGTVGFPEYINQILKHYSKLSEDKKLITEIEKLLTNPQNMKENKNTALFGVLKSTYEKAFDFKCPNYVYQELLYLSEVVAVYTQKHKNQLVADIMKLALDNYKKDKEY